MVCMQATEVRVRNRYLNFCSPVDQALPLAALGGSAGNLSSDYSIRLFTKCHDKFYEENHNAMSYHIISYHMTPQATSYHILFCFQRISELGRIFSQVFSSSILLKPGTELPSQWWVARSSAAPVPPAEHPKSGKMKRGSRNGMERSTGRALLLKVKIDFRFLRFAAGGLR